MTSQPQQGDEMEVNPSAGQDVPTIEFTAKNDVPIAESGEGNLEKTKNKRGRSSKKTSDVWAHFKIRVDGRAECNYCGQDYKYDTKTCGTSTLRTHVEVKCKKYPLQIEDKKQKAITLFTKSKAAKEDDVNCKKYDLKEVRGEIATYFILAELPFRHVQDEGFQWYTRYFYPTFQFPSRVIVTKDIYQMYLAEKIKLKRELKKHRKRILSFIQVPSHKGEILGKELIACLHDWGIDKVFCVTVKNASSNDVALKKLKSDLQEKKHGLVLDGEMFHMRCCAHILNLVVISHAISCIWNAVRYPMSSTARWNSTFLMLEAALKFKKAFEILDGDANYTKYFEEERVNGKRIDVPPIHHDWDKAQVFVKFLRTFYKVIIRISGSLYVTSNLFFKEFCIVQGNFKELGKDPSTLLGPMAFSMQQKFDKYWGNLEKMNVLLYIATILDPRCKMEAIKHGFGFLYDDETSAKLLKHIEDVLYKLYNFYKEMITPPTPSLDSPQKSGLSAASSQPSLDDSDDFFSTYFT
ncbi:hypothetical protein UlMin_039377 [Ulmus minor]